MGLFENLGRKVEQFKQEAKEVSEEEAPYECADCGALVYSEREDCPECGGRVVPRSTDESGGAQSAESSADSESADDADER